MPAKFTIIGLTHKGAQKTISPADSSGNQVGEFRDLKFKTADPEFAEIYLVNLNLHPCLKLRTPEAHKENEARRAEETESAKAAGEAFKKAGENAIIEAEKARAKVHADEVAKLSKANLAAPNRTVRKPGEIKAVKEPEETESAKAAETKS